MRKKPTQEILECSDKFKSFNVVQIVLKYDLSPNIFHDRSLRNANTFSSTLSVSFNYNRDLLSITSLLMDLDFV